MGCSAGLGSTDGGISERVLFEGIPLLGEYVGDVPAALSGGISGDTDAEYVLPWTSPRNSGDVGERGAARRDCGAVGS